MRAETISAAGDVLHHAEYETVLAQRALQACVLIGLTLLALGVAFPIYGSPGLPGIGRLTLFRVGPLLLLLAAPLWLRALPEVLRDRRIQLLLLFAALRAVSLVWSPGAVWGVVQIRWFWEGLVGMIMVIACGRVYPRSIPYLHRALVVTGGLSALVFLMQFLELRLTGAVRPLPFSLGPFGIPELPADGWYPVAPGNRILGAFQDPNLAGSFMVYVICLALPAAFWSARRAERWIAFAAAILALIAVLATASRQAMLVATLVTVWVAITAARRRPGAAVLLLAGLAGAAWYIYVSVMAILQGIGIDAETAVALDRLAQAAETGDISGGRFMWYQLVFQQLGVDTLLLGIGEGSAFAYDVITAHNAYLVVLFENGVWMLGLLLTAIALLAWRCWRDRVEANGLPRAWLDGGALIVLTWALFIGLNWAQMNQIFVWPFMVFAMSRLATPARAGLSPRRA